MITLYGAPQTRTSRISWLLEELALPWQYHYINFAKGDSQHPDFLSLNPCGKIPVIIDDNQNSNATKSAQLVLSESMAICLYLAEKYNKDCGYPIHIAESGTPESALHHQWLSFITCELEQPLWTLAKHKFALPKSLRQESMPVVATWEFDKVAAVADSWLPDSDYLLGDTLSIADILLTHTLMWATKSGLNIPPKLARYRDQVASRPALVRALEKEQTAAAQAA
ncbi:glutathione S-transferase family protein [Shewanella surugensis]|uniref:Glutathione S-transferase family protein n=1 Tax=Shewanella surugensis TaxID=212020 RepID=A0ABT0L5I2_9GAMM|nr:glutathione S-transferase family protein [Shewanella surugensis]MCL1122947.1 glutathione S-transferase family protein [Shewanella surugensis]